MKNRTFSALTLGLAFLLTACSQQVPKGTYRVDGKITGVEDGAVIKIYQRAGGAFEPLSADTLKDGKFLFTGQVGENPELLYIMGDADFTGISPFWVASGKTVRISGTGKLPHTWSTQSTIPEQKMLNRFQDKNRDLEEVRGNNMANYNVLVWKYLEEEENLSDSQKDSTRIQALSMLKINDSLSFLIEKSNLELLETEPLSNTWYTVMDEVARKIKYLDKENILRDKAVALYEEKLTDAERATPEGEVIGEYLFPPVIVKIGDEMADADLYDLEGNLHHLADYKGKHILLDFWSWGCGPCIMAIPEMGEVAEIYRDRLTIISLSQDTKEQWEKASEEHQISWVNLNQFKGRRGLFLNYNVNSIPHYVMISPEGKIVTTWGGYGPGGFKKKVAEVLD